MRRNGGSDAVDCRTTVSRLAFATERPEAGARRTPGINMKVDIGNLLVADAVGGCGFNWWLQRTGRLSGAGGVLQTSGRSPSRYSEGQRALI